MLPKALNHDRLRLGKTALLPLSAPLRSCLAAQFKQPQILQNIFRMCVGQSGFGNNCKSLSLAWLTHQFDIYPCYESEWTDAASKALFPSYGKASSLTLQIYFNYVIILTERITKH